MRTFLVAALFTSAAASAYASDYGCKVLLCLSNPASNGGPKGVAECVPPINQLFHDLRKGRPFPSCDIADGNDGSSYARVVFDPYDPCPALLQPALPGSYVTRGMRASAYETRHSGSRGYIVQKEPKISEPPGLDGQSLGPRACVGKLVGSYHLGDYDDNSTVAVYDQVIWQPAHPPQAIDVFINNALHQRVRW
ncbi:hypothetical protein [Comamonas antarctica]|uniref:Uncharacterized protein n=1 Tax=Comamonas antarctica TaxID=2743470 RepID=A0A6N1XC28_9BURK|nr:hypothetical protein [Comamonas antarctica]QKV55692.1 hypothetical protein HUK68_22320 [Comamonas antarctica]